MPKLLLDGDSRGAVRAQADVAKAQKEVNQEFEKGATAATKLKRAKDETFGTRAVTELRNYLTGLASITGAIALARAELEAFRKEQEKITRAQLGGAAARDVLKRNIAGMGPTAARQFEKQAEQMAGRLSLPQGTIDTALAEAYSASGGNPKQALERVNLAARFLKTAPDQIGAFSGSLGDISKGTGDQDSLRNLGFLIQIGAMSRVADAKQQAASIPKALAGARPFGATGEQAGALFGALSVGSADFMGEMSGTGVIRAAEQLDKFFAGKRKDRSVSKEIDTFGEYIDTLHGNRKMAEEFMGKASFEAKVKGPLRDFFLNPKSEMARQYRANLQGFGTPADQRKLAQNTLEYLDEGRTAVTAGIERAVQSGAERWRLGKNADLTPESRDEIITRRWELMGGQRFMANAGAIARGGFTMSPSEAIEQLETGIQGRRGGTDPELIKQTQQMISELKTLNQKTKSAPPAAGVQE